MVAALATACFSSSLLAKSVQINAYTDQARVAAAAQPSVREHEAVLTGGRYTLDMNSVVGGNTYTAVLPGVDIPKDTYVTLNGNNETACVLYVEICTDAPDEVAYSVASGFSSTTELAPRNGGTMYKYDQPILPDGAQEALYIIRDNKLTVSDTFRDRSDQTKNAAPFTFEVYAYLLQTD